MRRRHPIWACLLWLAGCGGATAAQQAEEAPSLEPTSLYPLQEKSAWAYDVNTGAGENVLAVTRVMRVEGDRVHVRTGGDEVVRYELRPQGIYRAGSSGWLLKAPIEVGAQWKSGQGRTARVTSVNASAQTPAQPFDGCVEVHETGGEPAVEVTTVYCPGVGPVYVESVMSMDVSGRQARVTARLRGHQIGGE